MLAPIVMGVLGRMKNQGGLDASKLPDVLQHGTQQAQNAAPSSSGFDLNSILDSNHDGQITDDVARMGKSIFGNLLNKG